MDINYSSNSDDSLDNTPPTVIMTAKHSSLELLPEKSRTRYEICYKRFMKWRKDKVCSSFSENVLIAYVGELSQIIKPNSLWTHYSMLRSTLSIYHNVDITKYFKLKALLKRMSDGYIPKKSKTLTTEQINQFLHEAPDFQYLFTKVALIVGISGACRKQELTQLKIENIENLGSATLIKIPATKTKQPRAFTLTGEFHKLFTKYYNLRPTHIQRSRFFVNYQQGKSTKQPVGVNKFGSVPKIIAKYLHLKDPELYAGHCFRRSSATILVDAGGDITTLKQHGGWKWTAVAETYIDESMTNKMEVSNKILNAISATQPCIPNEAETVQFIQEESLSHD